MSGQACMRPAAPRAAWMEETTPVDVETERIGSMDLDAAFDARRELGPGLREKVYERALQILLERRGLRVDRQVELSATVFGETIDEAYRLDLWVDRRVVVEVKRVESVVEAHRAQLRTYLWFSGSHLGFVINFHEPWLRAGIFRHVETRPRPFPTPSRS